MDDPAPPCRSGILKVMKTFAIAVKVKGSLRSARVLVGHLWDFRFWSASQLVLVPSQGVILVPNLGLQGVGAYRLKHSGGSMWAVPIRSLP